jgi:hypothetical protein
MVSAPVPVNLPKDRAISHKCAHFAQSSRGKTYHGKSIARPNAPAGSIGLEPMESSAPGDTARSQWGLPYRGGHDGGGHDGRSLRASLIGEAAHIFLKLTGGKPLILGDREV